MQYTGTPAQFVWAENAVRRHVDNKTLAAIEASLLDFDKLRSEQAEAGKQGADAGKLGGRGHLKSATEPAASDNPTKPLVPNSAQGVPAPKPAPKTRDHIAARTGVSRNTAQKAMDIAKHAPELVPQIAQKKVTFEDAAKEAKRRAPARKPPK